MKEKIENGLQVYNSYEKKALLNDLRDKPLDEEKAVFQTIIYNQGDHQYRELYWSDIIEAIYDYYQYNEFTKGTFPKYFYSEQAFQCLENVGLNYNYIDRRGFNFLHYFLDTLDNRANHSVYAFSDMMLDYVLDKTKNIYHLNNNQENILFSMINVSLAGIKGEKLDAFLKKYPNFDLNQKNIHGINILDKALQNSLTEVATHLIEEYKIDYQHTNVKGQNLLRHFLFLSANKDNFQLFDFLTTHLDTQSITEKKGLIDTWLSWAEKDAKVHHSSQRQCIKWIIHVMKRATEGRLSLNIDVKTTQYLEIQFRKKKKEFIQEYQQEFGKIELVFDMSEAFFQKLNLEKQIHSSSQQGKNTHKIKI